MSNEQVVYQSSSCETPKPIYDKQDFKITLKSSSEDHSSIPVDLKIEENPSKEDDKDNVLCILWKNGKLGAAYYNQTDSELYVVQDIVDPSPEFILTKILFRQIRPKHTITIGPISCNFVQCVIDVCKNSEDENSASDTTMNTYLPPNVQLLKVKEFQFDTCHYAVLNLRLAGEPDNATDHERNIFLNSILDFNRKMSIHALGSLLLFLNKYNNYYQSNTMGSSKFLNLNMVSIHDMVLIDGETFSALQIFNSVRHPASFKRGRLRDDKEGLSIFNLLNRCRSFIGQNTLRSLLLHPTNDIEILRTRHEFISFCLRPVNDVLIKSIQDCMKYIFNIPRCLTRIYSTTANLTDWKKLLLTLQNILAIYEMCKNFTQEIKFMQEFVDSIDEEMFLLTHVITQTIDFDCDAALLKKVTIKNGIDDELDAKKRYREEIRGKLTMAARCEFKNFPSYIDDCTIIYIPEIGYIVSVKKWSEDAEFTELEKFGFQYLFTLDSVFHYKSPVCLELDKCLGDIYTIISNHETRIVLHLCQHVYGHSAMLKRPLKFIALFDSLISMSEVAKELGYVQPILTGDNTIEIIEGRHALLELCIQDFVPNNFTSGMMNSHIKIVTGPNASGKSIYLKQNALIVYMAHIGSYVPAKLAKIGMMASIHSRIHSTMTAFTKLSTFMSDLRQISEALYCSSKNSFIVIDEFGKGTAEFDGLALLTSVLETFLVQDEFCPHIIVSTHFLLLTHLIQESPLVEHFKFDFKTERDQIIFLYKLMKGTASSYAMEAALNADISKEIIARSKQILQLFNERKSLKYLKDVK